jgi:hypothetical protein
MISVVSNTGMLRFRLFTGSFTGAVFIEFLRRLLRDCGGRKVHLIVDGHPVHGAKAVSAWVGHHAGRIELHFLPGYSPKLNPVELLNHASRRMPRAGDGPGRWASSALSCMSICVVASISQRSWSASSNTPRLGMPLPHESHHLPAEVITVGSS